MIETSIHKARSLQNSYITRQQCFIKILQPGSSAQPSMLTKVAKMPTYTWNQTLEAKSRHCIEDITASHLLRLQSLDVRELHSDAIVFQRPSDWIDQPTFVPWLSIYGGNDVQLPSAVVITVSLESGKALADLVPTGHGNLHTLPFESRLEKSW